VGAKPDILVQREQRVTNYPNNPYWGNLVELAEQFNSAKADLLHELGKYLEDDMRYACRDLLMSLEVSMSVRCDLLAEAEQTLKDVISDNASNAHITLTSTPSTHI
jgi:hypothetical protein